MTGSESCEKGGDTEWRPSFGCLILKNNSDSCPDTDVISMDHPGHRSVLEVFCYVSPYRCPHTVVPRVLTNTVLNQSSSHNDVMCKFVIHLHNNTRQEQTCEQPLYTTQTYVSSTVWCPTSQSHTSQSYMSTTGYVCTRPTHVPETV